MKKRILALALGMLMVVSLVAACGGDDDNGGSDGLWINGDSIASSGTYSYPTGVRGEGVTINLWAWNDEVYNACLAYKAANPDFKYDIVLTQIPDTDQQYIQALNTALVTGGSETPDFFVAESASVINYTQFDYADYALPYENLFGVNPADMINAAEINSIIKSAGANPSGKIVSLGFQSTGSAFIYRRDLATQIWGTDDPAVIETKVGPGYDKFTEAAAEAKAAGVYMVVGEEDLWQAIRQSPNRWIQNDKLVVDAQRMSYLDIGYTFYNEGYSLKGGAWSDAWTGAMAGNEPVLGFLGPAWLINYVMAGNSGDTYGNWAICMPPEPFVWGGSYSIVNKNGNQDAFPGIAELIYWMTLDTTDSGFQYGWANGTLGDAKDSVASGVVMARSDGTLDFLGGQNAFDVFIPAGASGTASGWGPYDETLQAMFRDHANQYFNGTYADKDETIAKFQQEVLDVLGIES